MYGRRSTFNFTAFVKESYLGILLNFRQAVNDDHFHDQQFILLSSLCRIMAMISADGTDFLDATADKMLIVLRAFTSLGVAAASAWKTYIETLSDKALLRLLPHTLVSIEPLFQYEEGRKLLKYIFEERRLHFAAK
ncbi:unnamed protein product [Gongylonema pulchrum]|uniref:Non-specific serine/threonine protein kinase n=1 Tax=Gongylonema pulchrum TaxID=637853 RepID=A0A183CXC0_9BILA|nr:unnamed protein product [Gongylonema pulchrum]